MSIKITDKRVIDKPQAAEETPAVKEPLVVIRPETLKKAQGEAIRGWLLSVMSDAKNGQQAKVQSV